MKTFRMIGMALFAVFMCVNFTSCGGSDDDPTEGPEEGGVTEEKKLVEMKLPGGETITTTYSYDNKNRLASALMEVIYNEHHNSSTTNYTWGNDAIVSNKITFMLSDGLIKSTNSYWNGFTYNSSKQLVSLKTEDEYDGTYITTFSWENNKMTKIANDYGTTTISYSNKTCKGYYPLMAFFFIDDLTPLFVAHPELIGMRSNQLPSKISSKYEHGEYTTNISYTFTSDGYIESCTTQKTADNSDLGVEIYKFKWQ